MRQLGAMGQVKVSLKVAGLQLIVWRVLASGGCSDYFRKGILSEFHKGIS